MMIKRVGAILILCALSACEDKPYQDDVQAQKNTYNFTGNVELGSAVYGSDVTAYQFNGLKRGELLGKATGDRNGQYQLNIETSYKGPVLLVSSGGLYRDLFTGETVALKPEQELKSAITHIDMPERSNINAWTTLAVSRVLADRGFWDSSVASLKDIDRINVDFAHVSYFLTGSSPKFVNIKRQDTFDADNGKFIPDEPSVVLHLANAGLSKIASDFSAKLSEEGIIVSTMDLVAALAEDLSDRVFDGRKADGTVVFIGKNNRINLNSYTMRKNLSEAILLYSQRLQRDGKMTEEDRTVLKNPGKIIDNISKFTQPELFPAEEKPKPIDETPPTLDIRFAKEHAGKMPFAFLSGPVFFDVQAYDDTKVEVIKMVEPKVDVVGIASVNSFGSIPVDKRPQAIIAAKECGKESDLKKELKDQGVEEANVICACFEAIDVFGNKARDLKCFQRSTPKALIEFPDDNTVLSAKSFFDGVTVKARVTSGLPIDSCTWKIRSRLIGEFADGVLPSGEGVINGTTCDIEDSLDGANLLNGNYYLVINASDAGDRALGQNEKRDGIYQSVVSFQVFKEPPVVEVISPKVNDYFGVGEFKIFGKVQNSDRVKSIDYRLSKVGTEVKDQLFTGAAIDNEKNTWIALVGRDLSPGRYQFDLLVTDIYGNTQALEPRMITIDHEAPKIMGALNGVPQQPYIQETMAYTQRFDPNNNDPRYLIEPAGEAIPIDWKRTPKIYRWLPNLDNFATAPTYRIKVADDIKLSEVRYIVSHKCKPLAEAVKKASGQDGTYDIGITQMAADFDLSRDSETEGHTRKYCLSIWAIDEAGNATNHNIEFIWKVIMPPVSLAVNSKRYKTHRKHDDLTAVYYEVTNLFRLDPGLKLKKDLVIAHAILSNPFIAPVSTVLKLDQPIEIMLNNKPFNVDSKYIRIKYFAYDLKNDAIGEPKDLLGSSLFLSPNETVVAKFTLSEDFPLEGINTNAKHFWQSISLEAGFKKGDAKAPDINGLTLMTSEAYLKENLTSYKALWDKDYKIRRRSSPQYAG